MRLLHTQTLAFTEFYDVDIPDYAILSHRWQTDEVTFQDISNSLNPHKAGWTKLRKCCAFALRDGYQWVWIDTCCIDKSSSSELTEAINSMYRWYQNSAVCYAYLYDAAPIRSDLDHRARLQQIDFELQRSEWFTRSWTLQELIAPKHVWFIASDWADILGTKESLKGVISRITGIAHVGRVSMQVMHYSIARRMSWASKRRCTRVEDAAYSLMGIFNVSMPLLYGEGSKAFLRLQLEILKTTNDESIFAWRYPSDGTSVVPELGLLAASPSFFCSTGDTVPCMYDAERPPFSMTHKGLQFEPQMVGLEWLYDSRRWIYAHHNSTVVPTIYVAGLNCHSSQGRPHIVLMPAWSGKSYATATKELFFRFRPDLPLTLDKEGSLSPDGQEVLQFGQLGQIEGLQQRKRIFVPQPGYQNTSISVYQDRPPESVEASIVNAINFVRNLDLNQPQNGQWIHLINSGKEPVTAVRE